MVSLFNAFSKIKKQKVVVAGDLMLDTYTIGKARRISPEAPVPVLHVQREEHRPGGAGNVALNLAAMGAEVMIIGRIGQDSAGEKLAHALGEEGIYTTGLFTQNHYPTPIKNRVIADNQQMVRIDYEQALPLPELLEQQAIDSFPELLKGASVLAISDYGKGFLTKTLLSALIETANQLKIPVITDPKGIDYSRYLNSTVIKPNLGEVYQAANLSSDAPLEHAASRVLESSKAKLLMVTRSEEGISLFYPDGKREDFAVKAHDVRDVTGAGDTVLAMLALSLANQLNYSDAARLCNVVGGIAIERFGCARVTLSDIARRLLGDDLDNKIYDEGHLFALQEALKGKNFILLSVSSKDGISSSLFSSIRQLSEKHQGDLLIAIEDLDPAPDFLDVLASLHDVDYMIVNSEIRHLTHMLQPTVSMKLEKGMLLGSKV